MFGPTMLTPTFALAMLFADAPGATNLPLQTSQPQPTAIFGGQPVPEGGYPEVVVIQTSSLLCTGTLLTNRVVLTAAHCFPSSVSPSSIRVSTGNSSDGPEYDVASYGVHPEFCGDLEVCKEDIHDIAYILLDEPIPTTPAEVLLDQADWDAGMFVGAMVTLVGFGQDENDDSGVKRFVTTPITAFSPSGHEFRAGGEGKDSCQGDSGGPAFIELTDGRRLLVGVTSRGTDCGEGGYYTLPASELCWLRDEAGVDFTDASCSDSCACLISDPTRAEGCCSINKPLSPFEGLALVGFGLWGLQLRRKR